MSGIDFVITWVDGNDPDWKRQRMLYQNGKINEAELADCRFRDWGILKYWFRAVEENAPWVRRIHFVTCGQRPEFLNCSHPKLHLADHVDFMAKEDLPTFSSHAIEVNMHRIEGLAEHFVYFNDDFFLNRPVSEETFFRDGKPCYLYMYRRMKKLMDADNAYQHARYNSAEAVYRHYRRSDVLKQGLLKVFHPVYGLKNLVWNLYCLPQRQLLDFMDPHVAVPFLKSTFEEVWRAEPALMKHTSHARFRDNESVNPYIFRYWDLARGNFAPANPDKAGYAMNQQEVEAACKDIRQGRHALICLNDSEICDDFEEYKNKLIQAFEERYPQKSSFER